ncbi:glycerate kinase [Gracilimonas sp. Q87]|uniref:glycerate kinase type-2 family protein n=1 Tax=Gracilimonas sp. Q87 TaxID=3384766 RepID=UPI003984224A
MKENLKLQSEILSELANTISGDGGDVFKLKEIFSKIDNDRPIWLLGAGKASMIMARQAEDYFGDGIKDGLIITDSNPDKLRYIQAFTGSHPYPNDDSVSASYELMDFASKIPETDQVLFCLSGGASSLFCIPAGEIEIEDLSKTYKLLLNSGASIHEINIVRKHLSETSGGRLGKLLSEHKLLSVIISDVPGDDPSVIGSGPTVPDPTTFKECFAIVKKYKIWPRLPHSVRIHISKGMHGDAEETPKPSRKKWRKHKLEVISAAKLLAMDVGERLEKAGFNIEISPKAYDMEISKLSKKICSEAISVLGKRGNIKSPAALIYFGESTVNVKGDGKGGRNQHLALMAALTIEGQHPISVMSLATDGIDGPTDSAGAIVNSMTTLKARKQKLEPEDFLQAYNSYEFHNQMDTYQNR